MIQTAGQHEWNTSLKVMNSGECPARPGTSDGERYSVTSVASHSRRNRRVLEEYVG